MKSRGEEHKGDKESDGDSEEEAFVLMETTGSSLKFHHTLLHGSEEGRKEDRQTERKKERKKEDWFLEILSGKLNRRKEKGTLIFRPARYAVETWIR